MTLENLRTTIDSIDDQLLTLLSTRMNVVKTVGELKRSTNGLIYRPEREKNIIDRLERQNSGLLNRSAIEAIFLEIFAVARTIELPERIGFLGPEWSFTHEAAESRFGALGEYTTLPTIQSVFEWIETDRVKFGVVPIENNQEGVVYETIDLLNAKNINIVSEIVLPIHFSFATTRENIEDIKTIYSKDIAFRQCKKFIDDAFRGKPYPELIPVDSTSRAAKIASEDPNAAALCSKMAARSNELPILFDNVEDSEHNRTRFLILAKNFENLPSGNDKTTIIAKLNDTNKPGSLFRFLGEFSEQSINITKIDSRPHKNSQQFDFWFFIEFEGHAQDSHIQKILNAHTQEIKLLGSYVKLID